MFTVDLYRLFGVHTFGFPMADAVHSTIEILPDLRRLKIDGLDQVIGARAFDVFAYLDAQSGRVVTKAEQLEHVWANLNVEESNLTIQIAALRKLIGALSRIPALFVIAASSTFTLKGRSVDLAEVGQQLGVCYILEASIQSTGLQLRIPEYTATRVGLALGYWEVGRIDEAKRLGQLAHGL